MKNLSGPLLKTGRSLPKHLLLAAAVTALAACAGNTDPSSSANNSSEAMQVSSSTMAISSSSEMSSSSIMPSSSSLAPSSSSAASVSSAPPTSGAGTLLDSDGTFADGQGFFGGNPAASFGWNGEVNVQVNATTAETWNIQLTHGIAVQKDQEYTICFSAKAGSSRNISVNIDQAGTPGVGQDMDAGYNSVMSTNGEEPSLYTDYSDFKYTFISTVEDTSARLTMNFGVQQAGASQPLNGADVQVDNIGVYLGNSCGDPSNTPTGAVGSGSANIVGTPPITTEGNQVLFGGKQGSVAGMSLFWSNNGWGGEKYYNGDIVRELKTQWNAKIVRAAMGVNESGGYLSSPTNNVNRVKTVVDAAIANDMYVIIDWHTHYAQDYQAEAITFFEEMARLYGDKDNVIYEIYNEPKCPSGTAEADCNWDTKTSWAEIKDYADDVIDAIRVIDKDNLIIVGTPYYSQFVDEASEDPFNTDEYDNIAYTLHFYAATHQNTELTRAKTALKNGIPLFVTEWGVSEYSGAGSIDLDYTDTWMEFLYDNNISHANWALNDKAVTAQGQPESSSALKAGASANGNWTDADLTESGLYVKGTMLTW